MEQGSQRRRWRWTALLAGASLRAACIRHHADFTGDALIYGDIAHNIAAHHVYGLTLPTLHSTIIRLPGYPAFLMAVFAVFGAWHYVAVLWVQVAIDLASCVLLGKLAERMWGARVGMAALWIAALCPFTANYVAAALTETCSIFCVVLAFFALERWIFFVRRGETAGKWAWVVGAALSWAVLLRPEQGMLSAAVVGAMIWMWWKAERGSTAWAQSLKRDALMGVVVASAVVVVPLMLWGVRNWRVFHVVQPLAPKSAIDPGDPVPVGFNHWYRTWGIDSKSNYDVYWQYDGGALDMRDLPPRAFDDVAQREETARLYAEYNQLLYATPEIDAAFAKLAAERVKRHPMRDWVWLPMARELDMWLRPRTELVALPLDWWELRKHPGWSALEAAYAGLDLMLLVVAGVGLWRWKAMGVLGWSMLGFVAMRCALLLTLDNSEPRYTLECFPVVILLAAFAVAGRSSGESGSRIC
jgi:hypothetical protein